MPIFLFPRSPEHSERCVRVLQLTPIDDPQPQNVTFEETPLQNEPRTEINITAQAPFNEAAEAIKTEPQQQKMDSIAVERSIQDPGSAPISAFLTAAPFHTPETLTEVQTQARTSKRNNESSAPPATSETISDVLFSRVGNSFSHVCELSPRASSEQAQEILQIPISEIIPNPQQPRKHFGQADLQELAESIKQYGILQPLIVRKTTKPQQDKGKYELIAGERRLHAARIACIYTVPCILLHISDEDSASIALIENLQRKNLDHFEQAQAIQTLIHRYNYTQEQLAARLGCSQSYIANKLRILRLTAEEQAKIIQNNLSERHARALLQVTNPDLRSQLLEKIIENKWTVAETEQQIRYILQQNSKKEGSLPQKPHPERRCFHSIDRAVYKFKQNGGKISCEKHENADTVEWIIRVAKT